MKIDGLPVNFSFAQAALQQIEVIRRDYAEAFPTDPPFALMVGWGFMLGSNGKPEPGNVTVGYYRRSEISPEQQAMLEIVSGHKVVFFVTEEGHNRFTGKTVDYSPERAFFLR